jgi:DEAD/DEAH box helicase domain-containing protein
LFFDSIAAWQVNPWPPETGTVDRDLDVAISQFAPRSETMKDKAVHTAVGVVELYPGQKVGTRDGLVPALPIGNPRPMGLCFNCQAVVEDGLSALDAPAPGGRDPVSIQCPVCHAMELRVIDAREPKGFFTDQAPRDFEGAFEYTPRATRPTLGTAPAGDWTAVVFNSRLWADKRNINSINDDGGVGGFDFQEAALHNEAKLGAWAVEPEQGRYVTTSGPAYRIALLSRRVTDVLIADIADWTTGLTADPRTAEGRAAWYSFAFFLRLSAAALLDIDTTELDAGFRTTTEASQPIGQAFLSDKLENGAGYCRWLAIPENFSRVLEHADLSQTGSLAGQWMLGAQDLGRRHVDHCDTSCNRCLRDFYNLPYHGLLDWRLALDMARLAADPGAPVDLVSEIGGHPSSWRNLTEGADGETAALPALLSRLGFELDVQIAPLRAFFTPHRRRVLIERHPLWTDEHPTYLASVDAARKAHPRDEVVAINPFRILRRPADAFSV